MKDPDLIKMKAYLDEEIQIQKLQCRSSLFQKSVPSTSTVNHKPPLQPTTSEEESSKSLDSEHAPTSSSIKVEHEKSSGLPAPGESVSDTEETVQINILSDIYRPIA